MKENIEITEQDIFIYVFSRESLDTDKVLFIDENTELYAEEISFCRDFHSEKVDIDNLKNILSERIREYSVKVVDLYPVKVQSPKPGYKMKIAAASPETNEIYPAQTFIDKNSEYLTRIIRQNGQNKLFIYTKNESKDIPFNIIIYPQQKKFTMVNPSEGLLLEGISTIERIRIEQ